MYPLCITVLEISVWFTKVDPKPKKKNKTNKQTNKKTKQNKKNKKKKKQTKNIGFLPRKTTLPRRKLFQNQLIIEVLDLPLLIGHVSLN